MVISTSTLLQKFDSGYGVIADVATGLEKLSASRYT